MGNNHHMTGADNVLRGNANFPPHAAAYDGRRGYSVALPAFVMFGAVAAILAGGLMDSATSTEMPNATTKTYTPATDGVSPLDKVGRPSTATLNDSTGTSRLAYVLDVPRNVSLAVTHGSSIVAMSVKVYGLDQYRQPMTETLAVTATGTSKTAAGKKAFKWVYQIDVIAAGDSTANTASLAWANVLGLPYRVDASERVIPLGNAILDVSGTVVKADDNTATSTTGDPRGTYAPASAPDGTKKYAAWLAPTDPQTAQPLGLFGNAQA